MERVSSAPRLSFSNVDVLNIRNPKLSRSTPVSRERLDFTSGTPPIKSILVKSKESLPEKIFDDEEDIDDFSATKIKVELQFTAFVLICIVLVIVIPLSMIIIGSIHVNSCPTQDMIPLFLIIGGSMFLSAVVLSRKVHRLTNNDENLNKKITAVVLLLHIAWFIAGCFWVYGAYEPDYKNESSTSFCNKTLYLFAFWFLNSIYLTLAALAVSFGIYIMFGRQHRATLEVDV